jgi:hypothetical protein
MRISDLIKATDEAIYWTFKPLRAGINRRPYIKKQVEGRRCGVEGRNKQKREPQNRKMSNVECRRKVFCLS